MTELTDVDKALLDIESRLWIYTGMKETAIRDATGLSMTSGLQRVNYLLDTEAGLAYAPATVNRLRRLREQRQRSRGISRNQRQSFA